jgi:hypothetical protein
MKKIILSLSAVLFSSVSFSQDTTGFTAPTSFVIEADSMSAKQITSNYLNWVALNFKSANDVIQLKDLDNSNVIIKCILDTKYTSMGVPGEGSTYCTIEFKAKDGKFKISFSQIHFKYYKYGYVVSHEEAKNTWTEGKMGKRDCLKYVININKEISAMKDSIEKKIKESGSNAIAKDDF